jgi:hypothetical protein
MLTSITLSQPHNNAACAGTGSRGGDHAEARVEKLVDSLEVALLPCWTEGPIARCVLGWRG